MAEFDEPGIRQDLLTRRRQLDRVARGPDLEALLVEVDAALERLDHGTYGVCDVCHEAIEQDRLARDPLTHCCSDHVTPSEAARLQADLSLARNVQLGLLPGTKVSVPGWHYAYWYEAASEVGGDFCDVIPVPAREETLVIVGDVSGKGVAASMLMSSLLATFRSLAWLGLPAGELLSRVNDLFCSAVPASSYATLTAAVLKPAGVVDLFSAGHWPPLHRHHGEVAAIDVEPGLPLGLFPGSRYRPARLRLASDEALLLFTDGVIDAEDESGEDFGWTRLAEAFKSGPGGGLEALVAHCLADVRGFEQGPRGDDLTLFAVGVG